MNLPKKKRIMEKKGDQQVEYSKKRKRINLNIMKKNNKSLNHKNRKQKRSLKMKKNKLQSTLNK